MNEKKCLLIWSILKIILSLFLPKCEYTRVIDFESVKMELDILYSQLKVFKGIIKYYIKSNYGEI